VSRARTVVLGFALGVGGLVAGASERPLTRTVTYEALAQVEREAVLPELRRVEASYVSAGVAVERRVVAASESTVELVAEVEPGECVSVVGGAYGRRRIAGLAWWPYGAPRVVASNLARRVPYATLESAQVCPMRVRTVRFAVDVLGGDRVDGDPVGDDPGAPSGVGRGENGTASSGAGGAELLLARGRLPEVRSRPIDADRVVADRRDWKPALAKGGLAAVFLALIGLAIESAVRRDRATAESQASLRRVSIALPAGLDGDLMASLDEARASAPGTRALRDRLVELAPLATAAFIEHARGEAREVAAKAAALREQLSARAALGRGAGYRAREQGLVVLTLLVRHRCELPDLPSSLRFEDLRLALETCLPRADEELLGIDVIAHPDDRASSIEPSTLALHYPELRAIEAEPRAFASTTPSTRPSVTLEEVDLALEHARVPSQSRGSAARLASPPRGSPRG
jgi:hypothetical protein